MATTGGSDGDYQDYWQEINDIKQGISKEPEPDTGSSEDELESKTPDEAEAAADWLESAGLGELVSQVLEGQSVDDDVFESTTLTKAQQATIKRRITTLKSTLNRRKQPQQKTDVRDIFSQKQTSPQPAPPRPTRGSRHSYTSETGSGLGVISGSPPSSASPWLARNMSMHKRREYNMSGDVVAPGAGQGVEVLGIHPKLDRMKGDSDGELRLHSDPGPTLSDSDIAVTLSSSGGVSLRQSHHSSRLPSSPQSPRGGRLYLPPPPSPLSFSSSSSSSSPAWMRSPTDYSEGLPQIPIQQDSLGITRIDDLSTNDTNKLRPLLILELTTLFDQYHIAFSKRKAKKKFKDSGIFGVSLQTLVDYDRKNTQNPNLKVPLIFKELINFLDKEAVMEEGILRVPGSVMRIKSLRQELEEKFNNRTFQWEDVHPNDAAGLLKQFLRELPAPLLTAEYVEAFAQVEQIPRLEDQIQALTLLVLLLPDINRSTLQFLLRFLRRVVDAENKMTVHNVAMIMAPNLFLVQSNRSHSKGIKDSEFRMAAGTSNVVRMMMYYQDLLWTVPSTMILQMRHQYETEQNRKSNKDKSIMKLLGRKDKSEIYKKPQILNEEDISRGVIRVKAPSMNKFQMAIKLDDKMTAGDIVSSYLQDVAGPQSTAGSQPRSPPLSRPQGGMVGRGSSSDRLDSSGDELEDTVNGRGPTLENSSLYEIGGNIGERRLDSQTNVLEVLKHNPNAEWVIRHCPSH